VGRLVNEVVHKLCKSHASIRAWLFCLLINFLLSCLGREEGGGKIKFYTYEIN